MLKVRWVLLDFSNECVMMNRSRGRMGSPGSYPTERHADIFGEQTQYREQAGQRSAAANLVQQLVAFRAVVFKSSVVEALVLDPATGHLQQ